jgi:hypothetical protein
MTPMNNKSLLHFIFDQMNKLDKKEITIQEANSQAALMKQANNSLKYELDRAKVLIMLDQNQREGGASLKIRDVESLNFE